ncbi:hypothetical protein I3842_07G188700 [Carya illinoinensis]|uniref:IBH1-like N-terminal domain-containing protein n=1 Tax=Carya illinoinensis TaxID=32201 RepID=A0A922EN37_CARIL|nr:hypothetical protein I3842_07G188700 [Carya illinoinensis]
MRSPSSLKQEFLKRWMRGLQRCTSSKKDMNVLERKKVIKLSADLAIASARNGTTSWSRALIANASRDNDNRILAERILGPESDILIKRVSTSVGTVSCNRKIRSKKILKRSCNSVVESEKVLIFLKRFLRNLLQRDWFRREHKFSRDLCRVENLWMSYL